MSNEGKEIQTVDKNPAINMVPLEQMETWYNNFVKVTKNLMKENLDYGSIANIPKRILFKPGAEKLRMLYGLSVDVQLTEKEENYEIEPILLDYTYKATVKDSNDRFITSLEGNANSYEKKYAYLWVNEEDVPHHYNREQLITRDSTLREFKFSIKKRETSGKYGKPEEYWQGWDEAIESGEAKETTMKTRSGKSYEAYEMAGVQYKVPNPNIMDLKNTIKKIAQKRAFVGAVIAATGASEFYTQDIEDIEDVRLVSSEVIDPPDPEDQDKPEMSESHKILISLVNSGKVKLKKEVHEYAEKDAKALISKYRKEELKK